MEDKEARRCARSQSVFVPFPRNLVNPSLSGQFPTGGFFKAECTPPSCLKRPINGKWPRGSDIFDTLTVVFANGCRPRRTLRRLLLQGPGGRLMYKMLDGVQNTDGLRPLPRVGSW
ncbi:hypothetical protein F9C07_11566 [Aspergillus flavus]|uniref:Uncharacterized protein n=1 Tax=Aspergillus flavus (strain ATCC 200026 / FGSC A1120 / IAM 13836 / NRRL 3357 / JCM 12722 / SRRC 167) TaxID=332952 RepID=A0A7U2R3T9_ASPFN|nr:hypothetical protein F9C07_11566 [Aspergillus flavus]